MIVLDIETSGLDPKKHCMLSLGAVDMDTGDTFYGECSAYVGSVLDPVAMAINGFSEQDVQPGKKQTADHLYRKFLNWTEKFPDKLIAGHNVSHLDILFLEHYHQMWEAVLSGALKWPFGHRTVDLHSVAFAKLGKSLSHENICRELGLPVEPKPHHALNGALSERDAFKILLGL